MNMEEVDKRRGHRFLPPEPELSTIPDHYETEDVDLEDKIIHLHLFVGGCDWWIAELDRRNLLAFGYADLGDPQNAEWGYVSLRELGELLVRQPVSMPDGREAEFQIPVERELGWVPKPFSEVRK